MSGNDGIAEPIIALDAMGGDNAPKEIVQGAVQAARELGLRIALVGRAETIEALIRRSGPPPHTNSSTAGDRPETPRIQAYPRGIALPLNPKTECPAPRAIAPTS